MKNANHIVIGSLARAATAIGLGLLASAQGQVRRGAPLLEGSLENDIREGRGPRRADTPAYWGEMVVDLASDVSLRVGLIASAEIDPQAVLPLPIDLDKSLVLEGGRPGHVAILEIGGEVISGYFDEIGEFEVVIPAGVDVRGFGVRAAQVPTRTVTRTVDLDDAVEQAFASFDLLGRIQKPEHGGAGNKYELPELREGGAAKAPAPTRTVTRTVDLDDEQVSASFDLLGRIQKPSHGGAGDKYELPELRDGGAARAPAPTRTVTRTVDLDDDGQVSASFDSLGRIAKPAHGGAGEKHELPELRGARAPAPTRSATRTVDLDDGQSGRRIPRAGKR